MERIPFDWLMEIPPVTRTYMLGVAAVAVLEFTGCISKIDCYYSAEVVFKQGQLWRLISTFFYYGELSWDLVFKLFVIVTHSKSLELSFTHPRDYLWTLLVVSISLLLYSTFVVNLFLLGSPLNDTLLFIWSRRNPDVEMVFMRFIKFKSIYLPFFYLLMSRIMSFEANGLFVVSFKDLLQKDIVGILIGHLFVFLNDSYPKLHNCESPLRPIWYWVKKTEEVESRADVTDFAVPDTLEPIEDVANIAATPHQMEQVDEIIGNVDHNDDHQLFEDGQLHQRNRDTNTELMNE